MKEVIPIIVFFIIVGVIIASNYISHIIGSNYYKDNKSNTIHDLLQDVLPDYHNFHFIIDIIGLAVLIPAFFFFNETLTIEFLTKFLIIMFIRAFTVISTVLPKYENCDETFTFRSFFLGGCYDKIFSGHTSFILLLTLMYWKEHIINGLTLFGINFVNILAILLTRSHYTVDVILAVFVTTTVFKLQI
jgi:hypothetical protein